jgi:hypothetical protein
MTIPTDRIKLNLPPEFKDENEFYEWWNKLSEAERKVCESYIKIKRIPTTKEEKKNRKLII